MKKTLLLIFSIATSCISMAQSYNPELTYLGQYVQRMYLNASFQGAKVVSDIDKCYLISVVAEQPTSNDYATQRKAEVASGSPLGVARAACFEELAGVFASCGALHYAKDLFKPEEMVLRSKYPPYF